MVRHGPGSPDCWPSPLGYTWQENRVGEGDAEYQLSRGQRAAKRIFIGKANLGQAITSSTDFSQNITTSLISRSNLEVRCLGVRRTSIYFSSSGHCGDGIWDQSAIAHACRTAVLYFPQTAFLSQTSMNQACYLFLVLQIRPMALGLSINFTTESQPQLCKICDSLLIQEDHTFW